MKKRVRIITEEQRLSRLAYAKKYYEENKEFINARILTKDQKNRRNELDRLRRDNGYIAKRSPKQMKDRSKQSKVWREKNPDKCSSYRIAKKKLLKSAIDSTSDRNKIRQIYRNARAISELYGIKYHVDHVVPLSKGGKHHQDNLIIMRWDCNLSKNNELSEFWINVGKILNFTSE